MKFDRGLPKRGLYESDSSYEASLIWHDFKEKVFYENRSFIKHRLLEILSQYISKNIIEIKPESIYYRARIINAGSYKELMMYKCYGAPEEERSNVKYFSKANPFRGLTKEGSFVPPPGVDVSAGRANHKFVKYLYMSEEPVTAMFEVRPLICDSVNIARIRVNELLKIANIAVNVDLYSNRDATLEMHLMGIIQGAFSMPTNDPDDYIPTQIIAEYIKSLGYDGLRFSSSLHSDGVNLTVFNYEKCEAISSQDFRIEDIKLTARAAIGSANYHGDLFYIRDNKSEFLDFEKHEFAIKE